MNRSNVACAAALALCAFSGAAQSAIAQAASMSVGAYAELNGVWDVGTRTSSWGTLLTTLTVAGQARVEDGNGHVAFSYGDGAADWDDANSGLVRLDQFWSVVASGATSAAAALTFERSWSYTFQADANDVEFKMDYIMDGSVGSLGQGGWSVVVEGGPEGIQPRYVADPSYPWGVYSLRAALTGGHTYTAYLLNEAYVEDRNAGFNAEGVMGGNFYWEIVSAPVPEPQTYALMALGLVAMGAVSRRRRPSSHTGC